jgi:hypothetical protein
MELIVSFVFEYLSYRIGVALVAFFTMGRIRPRPQSNPFYFSSVGLVFMIVIIGEFIYLLRN